ncbi:S41 family peptidase [Sphingobacterium sp. BIGb0165]|uniref:S41 family peptidase n=1 Tax=Sphingobacterium sp. BIGb0165 TaxID=2940615 RepID=UPI0021699830|nr:S41 family peptidase [Sphingobacterium sp. BIGb0165]MCS4223944.1 hypothetical protein [Sphingobacterium sp. BIGb0165]
MLSSGQKISRLEQLNSLHSLLKKEHSIDDLKADVYYLKQVLEANHPSLYYYIDKNQLDEKFDSLINTLDHPQTSMQFRSQLMNVIGSIGDGHIELQQQIGFLDSINESDLSPYNIEYMLPIRQLQPKVINDRLFIYRNYSCDTTVKIGAEILFIDDIPVKNIIKTLLSHFLASDGYNTTFKYQHLNNGLFNEACRTIFNWGDTVKIALKQDGIIKMVSLTRKYRSDFPGNFVFYNDNPIVSFDDNWLINSQNDPLILTIGRFANADGDRFYHDLFREAQRQHIEDLIIDVRNNNGGSLNRVKKLLSYLIDKPTVLMQLEKNKNVFLLDSMLAVDKTMKDAYASIDDPIMPADSFGFKGNIYVLANGASFSAASVLPVFLSQLKNVTLVGNETGGGGKRMTAIFFHQILLPNTKLTLRHGLLSVAFPGSSARKGHGLIPDIRIDYNFDDYVLKKDKEMEWVMKDIAHRKSITIKN